ncbi:hypothetical protein PLESTB_000029800 [Pleodorina starrii]|uniref:Transmembrane protein n=1 Tax=Pleodorina starrii TaxID=330485 RepID=A0A9W6B9U4_9CHLO|nr:hypothetical protein PLESTM_001104700 [Pleodorina starrii]GLC47825.1 hypothetical protein PLESTB_000029800 [Pleodorina starrii]GLC70753.1 hypothetical protein PLESTF_001029600 [Pleodorina starrii]
MGCLSSLCRKIFLGLLSLAKVAISIAIVCIVTIHLYHVQVKNSKVRIGCLMMGSVKGDSVCEYTYAVCGLSMVLSLVTSLLLCITCNLCGLGDWFEFGIGAVQTAWWVIASIIISKNVRDSNAYEFADGSKLPKEGWRNSVAVLAWINSGIAAVMALIFLFQACKCLKNACSCCCGDDDDDKFNRV